MVIYSGCKITGNKYRWILFSMKAQILSMKELKASMKGKIPHTF
jgi:hypothetical protein